MAAPTLRRLNATTTADGVAVVVVPAVPADRALVISKLIVAGTGSNVVSLAVGGVDIARDVTIAAGDIYTESGLVVLAGETVTVRGTTAAAICSVFGEEVDN